MNKKQYHNYITQAERILYKGSTHEEKQTFYKCTEDCPQDLKDFIYSVHKDHFDAYLPNDWVYNTIHDAFLELADSHIDEITIAADCYYRDLYEWFSNPYAAAYCEDVVEQGLCSITKHETGGGIYHVIGWAQWAAKEAVYRAVDEFMHGE